MVYRSKNISYMPWLAQSASAKPVNNLAIPRVQNVELTFLQRFPDVLEDTCSRFSQHFFLDFTWPSLYLIWNTCWKQYLAIMKCTFCISKNTMNTSFTKFWMAEMGGFHCETVLAFSQVNHMSWQWFLIQHLCGIQWVGH